MAAGAMAGGLYEKQCGRKKRKTVFLLFILICSLKRDFTFLWRFSFSTFNSLVVSVPHADMKDEEGEGIHLP